MHLKMFSTEGGDKGCPILLANFVNYLGLVKKNKNLKRFMFFSSNSRAAYYTIS